MSWIRELLDTYAMRMKSPVVGSILFASIFLNWKPMLFLIIGDKPILERFEYWDLHTDFWSLVGIPIPAGIIVSLVLPWLSLLGLYISQIPNRLQSRIREKASHDRLMFRAMHELERESITSQRKSQLLIQAQSEEELSNIKNEEIRERYEQLFKQAEIDSEHLAELRNQIAIAQQRIIDLESKENVHEEFSKEYEKEIDDLRRSISQKSKTISDMKQRLLPSVKLR